MLKKTLRLKGLAGRRVRLTRTLKAKVFLVRASHYVARAPELELLLSASGRTPAAALRRLSVGIARQYELLADTPAPKRTSTQRRLLRLMRAYMEEAPREDDSEVTSRTASA